MTLTRQCQKCGEIKPLDEHHFSRYNGHTRQNWKWMCNVCLMPKNAVPSVDWRAYRLPIEDVFARWTRGARDDRHS